MKKDFTEGGYIEDAVSRTALIHPELSFRMTNNKKEILRTSGNGDMKSGVYSIYGKDIAQNLLEVDLEYENMKVTGVVGKPEIARSNRSNQLFYINGRFIKDKILSAATEEAYRTLIPNGKFGFCILNINMNPELVDVNVHPAKLEVRFSEEGKVFKAINYAVKNALLKQDITMDSKVDSENEKQEIENKKEAVIEEKQKSVGLFDIFRSKSNVVDLSNPNKEVTINEFDYKKSSDYFIEKEGNSEKKQDITLVIEETKEEYVPNEKAKEIFENIAIVEEKADIPEYKILGAAFRTYILLELDEDIYILDQHAAHERVLYEKVKENFYKAGGKDVQMLLLPDILELSKRDMRIVRDNLELFTQAGFMVEEFGENTIKIVGVPVICFDMDTKDLFMDIIDGVDFTNRTTKQDVEEKFIATVACKAAVKANMSLEESEIRGLLDQLLVLENPFTCPHGRPTAIRITKNEIEKKFGRK